MMNRKLAFFAILSFSLGEANEVKLGWEALNFAKKYEIEILRGTKVQVSEKVDGLEWKGNLPMGTFQYHVRAIDKLTRAGEWSELQSFSIKAPPVVIIAPKTDVTLNSDKKVIFSWEALPGVEKYRLQIQDQDIVTASTQLEVTLKEAGTFEWTLSPVVESDVPFTVSQEKINFIDMSQNWNSLTQLKAFGLYGVYEYTGKQGSVGSGAIPSTQFGGVGASGDFWFGRHLGITAGGRYRMFTVAGEDTSLVDLDLALKASLLSALTQRGYFVVSVGAGQRQLSEFIISTGLTPKVMSATMTALGAVAKVEFGLNIFEGWNVGLEGEYFKGLALKNIPRNGTYAGNLDNSAYRLGILTEFGLTKSWTAGGGIFFERTRFEYQAGNTNNSIESPSQYLQVFSRVLIGN